MRRIFAFIGLSMFGYSCYAIVMNILEYKNNINRIYGVFSLGLLFWMIIGIFGGLLIGYGLGKRNEHQ